MISFGYLKLTFDISMAFICYDCFLWICARARFYHAFPRRCFDNTELLKQSSNRNRGLFFGRYCDESSYKYSNWNNLHFHQNIYELKVYPHYQPIMVGSFLYVNLRKFSSNYSFGFLWILSLKRRPQFKQVCVICNVIVDTIKWAPCIYLSYMATHYRYFNVH